MATSKVYAYAGMGDSICVSERIPNRQGTKITGEDAQKIRASADVICVSHISPVRPNEWILHAKDGREIIIPHRQTGDYEYLAAECEKFAGRGELVILFS